MLTIKIDLKFYLYQILGVLIIWIGMTFFVEDITGAGKIIYYGLTSWLLFLIVLAVKKFFNDRKEQNNNQH